MENLQPKLYNFKETDEEIKGEPLKTELTDHESREFTVPMLVLKVSSGLQTVLKRCLPKEFSFHFFLFFPFLEPKRKSHNRIEKRKELEKH